MRSFAPYFEGKPSTINGPNVIRATPLFQVRIMICLLACFFH
jgi:hypothetical protein